MELEWGRGALLLFSAAAGGTGELTCRLTADGDTVVLFPTNSAGDAVEVDATTGQRLAGLRAHKRDSLRAVTERAMEYCAAVGAHVVGEPGPCGAVMAQQMWACLSGVFEESFAGAVDEDGSSSRWLVNERVAAGFTDLCQLARVHDDVFATFRGHPAMVNIIEHVTAEQGEAYLTLLRLAPHHRTPPFPGWALAHGGGCGQRARAGPTGAQGAAQAAAL